MVTVPSPPSPTASFYDLSDDEEGGYNTITHTATGRGVKLLFSKSKVYVHPTPSAKDNIPGFIALVQQKPPKPTVSSSDRPTTSFSDPSPSSLLLAWLPESSLGDAYSTYVKVDLSDADSPPKQSYLVPPPPTTTTHTSAVGTYAFAIPVSEIYSILVRPPSIGWWFGSLVVNTRAGDSFPALFFHDSECQSTILQKKKRARETFDPFGEEGGLFWGGDEVLRWLRRYVHVERSGAEPSVYLVDPSSEDKEGFGGGGGGGGGGRVAVTGFPDSARPGSSGRADEQQVVLPGSSPTGAAVAPLPPHRDAGMDPLTKALKEARWSFLEKLSQVTNFTRRTAQDVLDNPKIPPQVRRLMKNPEVQTLQDEFDSARLYLARWAMGIAEQSERDKRQRVWTAKDVLEMEDSSVGEFELLDYEAGNMSLAEKRKPVTIPEWNKFFDARTGRLQITPDEVLERIFHGGLDAEDGVRKEAWLFLLGVYSWDSSGDERRAIMSGKRDEYIRLKGAWWERLGGGGGPGEQGEWWREQKARIEKDVHRTDRQIPLFAGEDTPHPDPDSPFSEVGTNVHLEQMKDMLLTYNEYNRDLGYVQGMSDLLAPIYAVMQDDALAFWGFVGFMGRMERNFLRDQTGMRAQLSTLDQLVALMDPKLYLHLQKADSTNFFFFFRMLLVWFKREFEWADVLRLWECLWTDYLSSQFHLFIALAILEKHRTVIMDHLKHFDEILKYINELSSTIDLQSTLIQAESLFHRFRRTVDLLDHKHDSSLPAAPLRKRKPFSQSQKASSPSSSSKNKLLPDAAGDIVERQNSDDPTNDDNAGNDDAARGGEGEAGQGTDGSLQVGNGNSGGGSSSRSAGASQQQQQQRKNDGSGRGGNGNGNGKDRRFAAADKETEAAKKVVVTPELRALLGRERGW
ncbi:MAG: GTPase activating protein [Peltula sp. TS41687]|nr:MAG: GTPase activating protein [Peltula sp. TS41687]